MAPSDKVPVPAQEAASAATTGWRPQNGAATPRWVAAFTYWITNYRKFWKGSLASRILVPLMFLAAIGLVLGDLVDERAGGIDGMSYLHYVVPGILAVQAMWLAISDATYPVLASIKWSKQYVSMLSTPLRMIDVFAGHVAYLVVSVAASALIFIAVAAPFGAWASPWVLAAVPFVVLVGVCFAAFCMAVAAGVRNNVDTAFSLVFRVVMMPLFLFSGTFFPLEQLPEALRVVAYVTPLWHGIEASRMLATGTVDLGMLGLHGGYLVIASAALLGWAYRALRSRLVV